MSDFARVMEMAIAYGAQPGPMKAGDVDVGPLFGRDPEPAVPPTPAEMPKPAEPAPHQMSPQHRNR